MLSLWLLLSPDTRGIGSFCTSRAIPAEFHYSTDFAAPATFA